MYRFVNVVIGYLQKGMYFNEFFCDDNMYCLVVWKIICSVQLVGWKMDFGEQLAGLWLRWELSS